MFHRLCLLVLALLILGHPVAVHASGGGGSTVDTIKVSKCYYMAGATSMLIKASSSDPTARLFAYLPTGNTSVNFRTVAVAAMVAPSWATMVQIPSTSIS